jgi:hypothetical protein
MIPLRTISFDKYVIEWYQAPLDANEDCATLFNCLIAKSPINTIQIPMTGKESKWFLDYLRSKSVFMIPQIVEIFVTKIRWNTIKAELVKL